MRRMCVADGLRRLDGMPGRTLRVESALGSAEGNGKVAMGVVWKAEDTKLHRHVALKVLPEG